MPIRSVPVSFRRVILAGEKVKLSDTVTAEGTIEFVRVRFYQGQELDLSVKMYVEHRGRKLEEIFSYANDTDQELTGDNDYFEFDVTLQVREYDVIYVVAENHDMVNDFNLVADIHIDYVGGTNSRK